MTGIGEKVWAWLVANALLLTSIIAALMTVGFAVQSVRIDGFRVDLPLLPAFGPKGLVAENAELEAALNKMRAERDAAIANSARIADANTAATEKADTDEKAELEIERPSTERFIAAGGVRRCPTARADAATPGQGPGLDAGAGALPVMDDVPVVSVLPEDVRICTENTVKARAWQQWGLSIEANHAAPATDTVEP